MGYLDTMGTFARLAEPHTEHRVEPGRLAEEQSALRRVATLVAGGAPSSEVFEAVAKEVAQVLHLRNASIGRYEDDGTVMKLLAVVGSRPDAFRPGSRWPLDGPSMSREILRTGRPQRVEEYADLPGTLAAEARDGGFNRVAGAPIIVDGRVWGVIATSSPDTPLPDDLEERLAEFTGLVATAIANSQAHDELTRLAQEQAALRRMATLVAAGAPPREVFEAVSAEVAALIPADGSALTRYEEDGTVTALSGWATDGGYRYFGRRYELEGTVSGLIFETGRPSRVENYAEAPGEAPKAAREMGWRSSVGAPITVEGRLWGALSVISTSEIPLPPDTERRLAEFTELIATAIANSEAHEELARLADEQAALRRVATLAAQGASPGEVFEAVSAEVAPLIGADGAGVTRYEADGTFTALGGWTRSGGYSVTGRRFPLEGSVSGLVLETRRPSRIDNFEGRPGEAAAAIREMGWRSAMGAPISVEGRLWGVLVAYVKSAEPLPPDTERRLGEFTQIVATSIANADGREEINRLAEVQAALRRVATMVARGATPADVFEAVSAEVGSLVPADAAALARYETDGTATLLGGWTRTGEVRLRVGDRFSVDEDTGARAVLDTSRSARIDSYAGASAKVADRARAAGWRSTVAAPIIVEGGLWGLVTVASTSDRLLPAETEERLAEFTDLVATAIANAESHAELDASRARIVATADATRRRIERDLHDGAQQRLISLALEVRAAQAAAPEEMSKHRADLSRIAEGLTAALDGLREIALGIHPAILAEGGLGPAVKTLAQRSPIPVELDVRYDRRLAEAVEVAAYYVISEALTNAAKHSGASKVQVVVEVRESTLHVTVGDNGAGGADPVRGSGLLGLKDRAEAIGGKLVVESRRGLGTSLIAELPLDTTTR
jgi:signal transduction histidine kinase/uncharacterized protein YoaH (UPF0181 family)